MSILKLENVSKTYGQGDIAFTALHTTSFEVEAGDFIGIVGPSGSGKSTLLSTAGALLSPSEGSIFVDGQDITNLKEKELTEVRLHKIGFIFQFANLVPYLTVEEQLILLLKLQKKSISDHKKEIEDVLKSVGLYERRKHYPNQLSGGEKQRVAIARSFITNPKLILADEPTASLDSKRGKEIVEMIASKVKTEEKAAIMITHDETMLAHCNKIFYLRDGQLTVK